MLKEITIKKVAEYVGRKEQHIELCNLDIILGLSQLSNSIEKGYKLYIENNYEGYSFCMENSMESIKRDILNRSKKKFPIKFLHERSKDKFVNTVNGLEGEELYSYLRLNGWNVTPSGVAICIKRTYLQ